MLVGAKDLAMPDDFLDLKLVYCSLCRLPQPLAGAKCQRIDFLYNVPWVNRGATLLYYTVSIFHFIAWF
jgi:hypothetical protein